MQLKASSPQEYIDSLRDKRKKIIEKLRTVILENLPKGFEEGMAHGMIAYVVPLSLYPKGYHVNPKNPLMLFGLASEKNYISLHHMALYDGPLLAWFTTEWKKSVPEKLDMGKSCIRFKKPEEIPFELIGKLVSKMTPEQWIAEYEKALQRLPKKK